MTGKKDKAETEKEKKILQHMPTGNNTELKELIYAEAKLVSYKISIPQKESEQKSNPAWKMRLEGQIKRL